MANGKKQKMKRVVTFGVFDMLHIGHIRLFQHIKEIVGECHLIVAVQNESVIRKYKPGIDVFYTDEERQYMVGSLRYVDEVTTYCDVDADITKIEFDIFAKGPDQSHTGFQRAVEWCQNHGKEVVEIPRTEGISTTMIKGIKDNK